MIDTFIYRKMHHTNNNPFKSLEVGHFAMKLACKQKIICTYMYYCFNHGTYIAQW